MLPFANLGGNPDDEYFSDGLTEELVAALSRVQALRVVARTSAFAFKGVNRDIREIGRARSASTVLEGSVRKEGDRVRVTAQLIDVTTGLHLWSETYERRLTDIFEIQADLALRIAGAMNAELAPAERERLRRKPTEDLEAYTLYLKGRYFFNQRNSGGLAKAIDYFHRAIGADSQYAAACAGLANAYGPLGVHGYVAPQESRERMRGAMERALELDSALAEAYTARAAYLLVHEWDFAAAERAYRRAIELDPSYPTAHHWYGYFLEAMARFDEAVAERTRALELDPLAAVANVGVGTALRLSGSLRFGLTPFSRRARARPRVLAGALRARGGLRGHGQPRGVGSHVRAGGRVRGRVASRQGRARPRARALRGDGGGPAPP